MKLLTVEKNILDLGGLSELDDVPKTQFTVIDLGSDANPSTEPDILFPKLIYIEEYCGPALKCMIGEFPVILPLSWFTFIGEEEIGEVEIIPVTGINARNFDVIVSDPINGFRHHFLPIRAVELYMEYDWVLPKLKNGQAVAMPINDDAEDPLCVYLSHSKSKMPVVVNSGEFV